MRVMATWIGNSGDIGNWGTPEELNTPAHLIIGSAILARPNVAAVNAAAIAGSLIPDLSLYLLTFHALLVQGHSANHVFDVLYFSPQWQRIFAIDNSLFVWMAVLVAGLLVRQCWVQVLGIAGMLHVAFDFLLHNDDAHQHFWPLSEWVFRSPVSYWDQAYYGNLFSVFEIALCAVLSAFLWRRFRHVSSRIAIVVVMLFELAPAVMFGALL